MPNTDWLAIGLAAAADCPSVSLRKTTADILDRVEQLGPIRPPDVEFRRVYNSLRWNEPDRVMQIVNALMPRVKGPDPKLTIRADAWGYVIGTLDEWILQARVFYLIAGILESALRARLNTRLTDFFGDDWLNVNGIAPDRLREMAEETHRETQRQSVFDLLERAADGDAALQTRDGVVDALQEIMDRQAPAIAKTGADFLRGLTFGGLRMFFDKKELWKDKAQLQDLFKGRDGTQPNPPYDRMKSVMQTINEARNDISHYRPLKTLTFDRALFAAAELATWLGKDLQHVYGAIDTRHSTELSVALAPLAEHARWAERTAGPACAEGGCTIPVPFDWYLDRAPLDANDLPAVPVRRICLHHRVVTRAALHRLPPGAPVAAAPAAQAVP